MDLVERAAHGTRVSIGRDKIVACIASYLIADTVGTTNVTRSHNRPTSSSSNSCSHDSSSSSSIELERVRVVWGEGVEARKKRGGAW